jgi:hypothetical protein
VIAALAALLFACPAMSRADQGGDSGTAPGADARGGWSVGISVQLNLMTAQSDFVQPTASADRGPLHLEARYNYEALRTGSLWAGWKFSWSGSDLKFDLTPSVAGVFGDAKGFAAGFEWNLNWSPFELSSQDEFLFDLANWSASDFNYWAEVKVSPLEWLRAGLALQHIRAIATGRELQWGPMVGITAGAFNAAVYWMNPERPDIQYWSVTAGATF